MRDETKTARLTRRAILGMAAAVPAVLVPVATAQAKRRPPLGSAPSVTVASTARQVTTSGGAPGVQFTLKFLEPEEGVSYSIYELTVDGQTFRHPEPSGFIVTGAESFPTTASPLTASGTVSVALAYYRGTDPLVRLAPVQVTVLPAVAARPPKARKPHKPRKPPKSGATA
ncbi:MAG TPA: hypothetical protein VI110_01845 [Lapillicoccus sp.]